MPNPLKFTPAHKAQIVSADARWTVVLSGITVNTDPAKTSTGPPDPWHDCQHCYAHAPGGSPLAGTFTLTHADAEIIVGIDPTLALGTAPKCRWGYIQRPATIMLAKSTFAGDPTDPNAFFSIMLYDYGTNLFLTVGLDTTSGGFYSTCSGNVFSAFYDPKPCDLSGASVGNEATICSEFQVGKNGTATIARCT